MAEILYDTDFTKARESVFKFLDEYQPDYSIGHSYVYVGLRPHV